MADRRKIITYSAVVLSAVALAIGLGVLWHKVLKDRFYPRNFGIVCEGSMYRSGRIHSVQIEKTLKKYGIREIINLAGKDARSRVQDDAARKLGIETCYFTLHGSGMCSAQEFADVLEQVVKAGKEKKPLLIHCSAGVNRTGAVVALYRVLIQGKSTDDAYRELLEYGWTPSRNGQMIPHLNELMADIARILAEKKVIEKAPAPTPQFKVEFKY